MYAAGYGHVDIVKLLLDAGADVNERSRVSRTPLIWAAGSGQLNTVRLLLKNGADPDLVDSNGETAADLAAENGHDDVAHFLQAK